jgi:hypothetical protein
MNGPDDKTIKEIGPIWKELHGRLWHVTRPDLFLRILDDKAIKPDPDMPDNERWGTACGPSHYPYVRSIGGVSLFDLWKFDPAQYDAKFTQSNWRYFIPWPKIWAGAVWIEIRLVDIEPDFKPASILKDGWDCQGNRGRKRMPLIEAAHIGDLPIDAFHRIIFIRDSDNGEYHEWNFQSFDRAAYEELLPEWQVDYEIATAIKNEDYDNLPESYFETKEGEINLLAAMRDAKRRREQNQN